MKELKTIIKKELRDGESIFISTTTRLNSSRIDWWKFDEYTKEELERTFNGKEKVDRFWHEDGLCIVLMTN